MTIELALLISIVSVIFSIYFGLKNNKRTDTKEIEERVRENTRINFKLDEIANTVKEIKEEIQDLKKVVTVHGEKIVQLEASYKAEHKRLDGIERRLNINRSDRDEAKNENV